MEYPRWKNTRAAEAWLEANNPHRPGTAAYYDFNIKFWGYMLDVGVSETYNRRLIGSYAALGAAAVVAMLLIWVLS